MTIDLPYPDKVLWPNGRTKSPRWRNKLFQIAKKTAWGEALCIPHAFTDGDTVPIHIIVHPMPRGPHPDRDGVVSACKAYLDGIALAIGVNDRHFAAPTVEFAAERTGRFVIRIGT